MKTAHLNFHIVESACLQLPDEAARLSFWRESLGLSLESLEKSIVRIEKALATRDAPKLAQVAHKINGTISFLGGKEISERMLEIQENCWQETILWPLKDESAIRSVLAAVVNEIKEAREKDPLAS